MMVILQKKFHRLEYCSQIGEIYDIVIEDMDRQSRGLKG